MANFTVASFQFINPFDINAKSKLRTRDTQDRVIVLDVVQPRPFFKPYRLKTTVNHRLLSEIPLQKLECFWVMGFGW